MATTYSCRDVGVDCDWKTSAESADALMAKVEAHAASIHPTIALTPEVRSAVRGAFKAAVAALFALMLVASSVGGAQAEKPAVAPGTGLAGACNMLLDAKMWDTMDVHTAPQGDAGMFRAVDVSGCS